MQHNIPTKFTEQNENAGPVLKLAKVSVLFCSFMLIFVVTPIVICWIVFLITKTTFFGEPWMRPLLLTASTIIGGALVRQKMEEAGGGLLLFTVAMLACMAFALLTYADILFVGKVYSHWMPKPWGGGLLDYSFLIPVFGLSGMLVYKYLTLKQ